MTEGLSVAMRRVEDVAPYKSRTIGRNYIVGGGASTSRKRALDFERTARLHILAFPLCGEGGPPNGGG